EVGGAGITVTLYDNANNVVSATVTDAYGMYLFDNLNPGTYHVGFTLPTNYIFTGKDQGIDDLKDSDPDVATGMTGEYTLVAGDSNMTVDAGIYFQQPVNASLGDYVWNDTDQDGVQDAGEVGIAGVTVTLNDQLGNPIATTVTDATGHYYFTNLVPGTYSVTFTKPIGYIFSPQNQGDDQTDSDADILTGTTSNVTLAPGENNLSIDAGLYAQSNVSASLGNFVWNDADQDGIQDPSEAGVAGVLVTLYAEDGVTVLATTVTDEFGYYIFNNLTPDDYVVGFSNLPAGYIFSGDNAGNNDAIDSDPDMVSGKTAVIHLSAGEKDLTVDAGIYNPALPIGALGNFVWFDYNKDGLQTAGENGVPGVTVTLYDDSNNILAVTSTDASGHYLFNNLGAGQYYVGFSNIPPGYKLTVTNQGGDDAIDSDPSGATGKTDLITLGLGEINLTVDAGIVNAGERTGTATLGDIVWYDDNNNGIQDLNEQGVAGVTVTLYEADGITIIRTQTTDALGNYLFTGLDAGGYVVGFSNIPAGYTFSTANQGADDAVDGDADALSGGKTGVYTLAEGQDDLTVDAGIHAAAGLASLGNYVWNDVNVDGVQDAFEPGVPGVTVTLFNGAGTQLAVTTTDANGFYQFTGLTPGSYYVEFSNIPSGYEFTSKDAGANSLEAEDSDADPITGATEWVTLVAGQNYPDLDAGIFTELAGLGNYVWNDLNNDGIQDANESGIPGITVILYAADGVTPLASAITDVNGHYNFVNLLPGTYVVGFSNIPAGAVFSGKDQGGDDAADSDADQATGKTVPVTLEAGEYNPTIDAGIHVPQGAGLGNYVWLDADADGIQDANESGIGGVTVTLYNQAGNAIQVAITDQQGFYSFPNLAPGTYSVGFGTLPPNLGFTTSDIGANDSLDNDVVNIASYPNGLPISGQTAQVTIVAGEYNPTIDAGMKVQFPLGVSAIEAFASLSGHTAQVSWTTMDEKNVKAFEVERSIDNSLFEKVAAKTAKGNTTGKTDYQIADDIASLMNETIVYYRVKAFDVNGQYLYSNTVYVNPAQATIDDVLIYPTPFVSEVTVGYNATEASVLEIEMTDMVGSVVKKQSAVVVTGQNQILLKDLQSLSAGNYFIKVLDINLNKTFVKKITKK
ncbi:MAG: carboxypeptidase regulatory-like domain-containing protein, partial [Chitinophagaceae bacterium]|nr:carboxypeptidase regulatory-like domain-containing protein [Chitinophagaceae bacterium]